VAPMALREGSDGRPMREMVTTRDDCSKGWLWRRQLVALDVSRSFEGKEMQEG
jgi:hypothetical protein